MSITISEATGAKRKLDYGIDAPGLVRSFFIAGSAAAMVFAVVLHFAPPEAVWGLIAKAVLFLAGVYLVGMGCLMLFWSKLTKLRQRERTLDLLPWRGDEKVLDVGCGRGLMLVGAALRLKTGRAIGIDIWNTADQSSNGPQGAIDNARTAGVAEKIEVQTADMRTLPFGDQTFDVVVSHWAVHNLESPADRDKALAEMTRVLRPDGYLVLCDIEHRDAYVACLRDLGISECRMIFSPVLDAVLGTLSFGSFRPSTILARMTA